MKIVISDNDAELLKYLIDYPGDYAGSIATVLERSRSAMNENLKKLVGYGWIVRKVDKDRQLTTEPVYYYITKAGRAAVKLYDEAHVASSLPGIKSRWITHGG